MRLSGRTPGEEVETVDGLMMPYQLTIPALMRRAETLYGRKEIVTRRPDKSLHRYTYAEMLDRAKRLAVALQGLGLRPGDRIGTLAWNNYQHLEAYLGVPAFGGVLHTLNLRLHPDDLTYIIGHAGDRALLIDATLLPLYERVKDRLDVEHVIVIPTTGQRVDGLLDYEELLAGADPSAFAYPDLDENCAMAMCYTSGTTGRPKGVVYSHRGIVLHSLGCAMADTIGIREADVVLPVVPMFHANAWGLPFTCTLVGAKQVLPGPHLDPVSLLELFAGERVTLTAGVPTIWLGMLQVLDKEPGKYDLSAMRAMLIGGAAVPESMIRGFQERHGLTVIQGWGMTETAPVGSLGTLTSELRLAPPDEQYAHRAMAGLPMPLIEVRGRTGDVEIPWDGEAMGELEVRGPWVARAYHDSPEGAASFTADGWFRTGDIVSIHPRGYIEIRDRAKDVIKSGGEWISSVALENALMGHPAVAEAAVIAVPDPKWQERPLACVVLKEGREATAAELRDHLAADFAKWQLPDEIVFIPEIPKTSTGKFQKSALRERYAGRAAVE